MDLNALMLCYYLPPLAGANAQRNAAFVKYLWRCGWHPYVLSAKPNRRNSMEQGLDPNPFTELTRHATIHQCQSVELSGLYALLHSLQLRRVLLAVERYVPLMHMEYKIGWYSSALRQAERIINSTDINVVYSTSVPYSSHLVAARLHRKYKIPWIADFQDPWVLPKRALRSTTNPIFKDAQPWTNRELERMVATRADLLIANTQQNKLDLQQRYELPDERVRVIPNGFDPVDFRDIPAKHHSSSFLITCTGWFYEMPDPGLFFEAYRRLADKYGNTKLRLVGRYSRKIEKAAKSILQSDTWEAIPRVGHADAIQLMRESSVLLANLPDEAMSHWVPSKIFDYMAVGRPILLIAPKEGEAAQIVTNTGTGIVVGFAESEMFSALNRLYKSWQQEFSDWAPSKREIARYDRSVQAKKLSELFDSLARPAIGALPHAV